MTIASQNRLPYLLLMIPVAILLLVGWQLGHVSTTVKAALPTGDDKGSRMTGLRLLHHVGQRLSWTLEAPQALTQTDGSVAITQPRLVLFRLQGGETRVSAGQGWVSGKGDLATFDGHVLLSDEQNRQLTTESLRFEPEQGILYSDQPFQWHDGDLHLEGIGFQLNQKDKRVQVPQGVHVVFGGSRQKEK